MTGPGQGAPHMAADEEVDSGPRMRIGPYATRVAAISALVIALVVTLLLIAASRDTYEINAVFDDVRGLIPGGDVTAGSIKVGTVTDVSLNEENDPQVTMEIDEDFQMHQGAFANIRLASNVGAVNRVVELTEGDPSLPKLESGTLLSGKQTDNPVDFDLAVSTLTPKVRGDIKKVLIGLDEALIERGTDFDRSLRHSAITLNETANLLAAVNADGEALRTLVSEGQTVVSALASSPDDLGASVDRLAALLQVTGARQAELAESAQLLGPALSNSRALLERTADSVPNLRTLVERSGPLLDELGPFADQVLPATRAAAPFLDETRKLIEETPAALRKQVEFVTRAQPVIRRLDPLLTRLNPIADQLRVYAPETIGFFQNVADAASNYDRNGHLIRTLTNLGNLKPLSTERADLEPSDCGFSTTTGAGGGELVAPYHRTPGVNECVPWDDWRDSLGDYDATGASAILGGGG